ncbi:expressed unknown protein [Seminavis robusta]|uniref:Uncharacterized protein n=1 Tax=Seminavis robusta TaxID=568900 RepID=A0A9N8EWI2_9STRA|nr:expressed unknown protein [Seminavis robusta]|eukprot:Sro2510_g329790.1 n/a (293) ;mRNA; f:1394-2394
MAPPNPTNMPRSAVPKPPGPPLPVLLYGLVMVPIAAFAGWVVTYGHDEEALERKLRDKYGKEIKEVESRRQQMSEVYMAAIKNPGSDAAQEERLKQLLRGGKGDVKRHHAIDRKYYGTEEGLEKQRITIEEQMQQHQEAEKAKMKKVKKKLKKLKKKKKAEEEAAAAAASSSDTTTDSETESVSGTSKQKAAAGGIAAALASVASYTTSTNTEQQTDNNAPQNKSQSAPSEETTVVKSTASSKKEKKKRKKMDKEAASSSSSIDRNQIATLTAVAGVAALVGFLVGGGSRRQ